MFYPDIFSSPPGNLNLEYILQLEVSVVALLILGDRPWIEGLDPDELIEKLTDELRTMGTIHPDRLIASRDYLRGNHRSLHQFSASLPRNREKSLMHPDYTLVAARLGQSAVAHWRKLIDREEPY